MNHQNVQAFGTFMKIGDRIHRHETYLQWGEGTNSLGACLLLNPGSAKLTKQLDKVLHTTGQATGPIHANDPTMKQLIRIVERIHTDQKPLSGRFHLYNLFQLRHGNNVESIRHFEELSRLGIYDSSESFASVEELKMHPWLLLGWGVENRRSWLHLEQAKQEWMKRVQESGVPFFGKEKQGTTDYYHPSPQKVADRNVRFEELVELHQTKFRKD